MIAFLTGAAGSGKSTELLRRAREAAARGAVLVTDPSPAALASLQQRCGGDPRIAFRSPAQVALEILQLQGRAAESIDDAQAAVLFEEAAEPLLSLEWTEFIEAQLDPEVPGLRAPERFLDAAYRLFCKLRDARISPEHFSASALRGATEFYAKPPNFANPDLLYYTKEAYRDSLEAGPLELQRQYRREVDLAKILAKLYRSYLDRLVQRGCLTPRDAVAEAAGAMESDAAIGARFRERYPSLFADDVQEFTIGELQMFQAAYGEDLDGATFAGDRESATSTFAGARPDRVFALRGERVDLPTQHRSPFAVDVACRHLLGTPGQSPVSTDPAIGLTLFRATTRRAEALFIAEHVRDLLDAGADPSQVAIVFRSVASVQPYRDALLDRGVAVEVAGDLNLFAEPETTDALAVLWLLHDPYRHDYLLRVLSGPALALGDATLVTLCGDPPDAQAPLFGAAAEVEVRAGRWDAKHDVRLAWNVLRGDRDGDLTPAARQRIERLRALRSSWLDLMETASLPALVRAVWADALATAGSPGSARARYQQGVLQRLYGRIARYAQSRPDDSLGEFLEYAERRASSDFESCEQASGGTVRILSVDAARGSEFDHLVVPNVRAGAFPRWYAPDAFLYSPSLGMIAKENVGDAKASRTAKFSYYMYRMKTRDAYNREERRAFVYALRRARRTALVTAHERASRGIAAPEFLAELQAARLPGTIDVTDKWRSPNATRGTG